MNIEYDVRDFRLKIDLPKLAEHIAAVAQRIVQKRLIAGNYDDGSRAPQAKSYQTPPLNHTGKLVRGIRAKPSKNGEKVVIGPRSRRNRRVVSIIQGKTGHGLIGLEREERVIVGEITDEIERQIASGEFGMETEK